MSGKGIGGSGGGRGGGAGSLRKSEASEAGRSTRRRTASDLLYIPDTGPARIESMPFNPGYHIDDEGEIVDPEEQALRYQQLQAWQDSRLASLNYHYEIQREFNQFRALQDKPALGDKDLLLLTVLSALTELRDSVPQDTLGSVYEELGNLSSFLDDSFYKLDPVSYTPLEDFLQLSDSDDE